MTIAILDHSPLVSFELNRDLNNDNDSVLSGSGLALKKGVKRVESKDSTLLNSKKKDPKVILKSRKHLKGKGNDGKDKKGKKVVEEAIAELNDEESSQLNNKSDNGDEKLGGQDEEEEENWESSLEINTIIRRELTDEYAQACQRLGVVPVSYFASRFASTDIIMKNHGLGSRGAQAFAEVLKVSSLASFPTQTNS